MSGRRALLLAPMLAGAAVAQPAGLGFRVMRNGSRIGSHRVGFPGPGVAVTEVEILVRVLGITAYRLTHRFEEQWAGGRLAACRSRLERNGRVVEMAARAAPGGLAVTGPEGEASLPAEAAPLTWWNPLPFVEARPLFDNETGRPVPLRFARAALPGGGVRWQADGPEQPAGDYAADGRWVAWRMIAEDGSLITYEPL